MIRKGSIRRLSGFTHTEYLVLLTCVAITAITLVGLFGRQIKVGIHSADLALSGHDRRGGLMPPIDLPIGGSQFAGSDSPEDAPVPGSYGAGPSGNDGTSTTKVVVEHPVTLYPQPDGTTCWSAATTMLFGGSFSAGPGNASLANDGRLIGSFENVEAFAKSYELTMHAPQSWSPEGITSLLDSGPIMVGGSMPYGHMVVIGGYRKLDNGQLLLTIYDPWPPNKGGITSVPYDKWVRNFPAATTYIFHR
jgi:hypothetical protein